jgi:hypothetical protein
LTSQPLASVHCARNIKSTDARQHHIEAEAAVGQSVLTLRGLREWPEIVERYFPE